MRSKIIFLKEGGQLSPEEVGGKAYGLMRLIQGGFNVPNGFVVRAAKVDEYSKEEEAGFLDEGLEALEGRVYAVRSSAPSEDGEKHSYAGMFDTYLDVPADQVVSAYEKCLNSIKNKRLIAYTEHFNLPEVKTMAVIIQEMRSFKYAGVCFTMHPVKEIEKIFYLEMVKGSSEDFLSGKTTPMSFEYNSDEGAISCVSNEGTTVDSEMAELLKKVFEICAKIHAHFQGPQDIEWGVDHDGEIWILQSRPITGVGS